MAGIGPPPKRSEERIRNNVQEWPVEKVQVTGVVEVPDLGIPDPHPLVEEFWEALKTSGQSKYYEPSDWVYAKLVLTLINSSLIRDRIGAAHLQQFNSMFSNLLVSEGDRRRVRLEIERRPFGAVETDTVVKASERFKAKFSKPA